jgi:hypothetical protein
MATWIQASVRAHQARVAYNNSVERQTRAAQRTAKRGATCGLSFLFLWLVISFLVSSQTPSDAGLALVPDVMAADIEIGDGGDKASVVLRQDMSEIPAMASDNGGDTHSIVLHDVPEDMSEVPSMGSVLDMSKDGFESDEMGLDTVQVGEAMDGDNAFPSLLNDETPTWYHYAGGSLSSGLKSLSSGLYSLCNSMQEKVHQSVKAIPHDEHYNVDWGLVSSSILDRGSAVKSTAVEYIGKTFKFVKEKGQTALDVILRGDDFSVDWEALSSTMLDLPFAALEYMKETAYKAQESASSMSSFMWDKAKAAGQKILEWVDK